MRRPLLATGACLAFAGLIVGCTTQPSAQTPTSAASSSPSLPSPEPEPESEPGLPTMLADQSLTPLLMQPWRAYAGLVASSPVGGIDTSGRVIEWSRPLEVERAEVPDGTDLSLASGPFVAGRIYGIDSTIPQLVRVDMRDGSVLMRGEVVSDQGVLLGIDSDGWILDRSVDGTDTDIRYVPFDSEAAAWRIDWMSGRAFAAGQAGIVRADGGLLELRSLDGATSYDLAEVPGSAYEDVAATLQGDLVAWWVGATRELGYRDLATGRTATITVGAGIVYPQLAVVDGAVAVVSDQSTLWIWRPGSPFPARPTSLGSGLSVGQYGAQVAALSDGRPAFAVDAYRRDERESWALVDAATGARVMESPGWAVPASVQGVAASDDVLVAHYDIGPLFELDGEDFRNFATAIGYRLAGDGAPAELFRNDMVPNTFPVPLAAAGRRSAVLDAPSGLARTLTVRLRDGSVTTGTARIPGRQIADIAMSERWTAIAGWFDGRRLTDSLVLGPGGTVVRRLPETTVAVAQEGPITAYATSDGAVRTVDARRPAAGPVPVTTTCPEQDCDVRLQLDSGRLLVGAGASGADGGTVTLVDLRDGTDPRTITVPGASAGTAVLAGDLVVLVDDVAGELLSIDLASSGDEPIRRLAVGAAAFAVLALAGDRLVWCPPSDDIGLCPRVALAPVPAEWGSTRRAAPPDG